MNNFLFLALMLLLFLMILLRKSGYRYLMEAMRICHSNSRQQCSCSGECADDEDVRESCDDCGDHNDAQEILPAASENAQFLDKMGYFLPLNDDKNAPKYRPTSLQDVDPKGLA
jgi:hypothetical protein